ncbi:AdeC/AdeK/OprM family multidrug efflux complex outer membrane factor [Uliginosibacterium sediminicola]|uniref:AdeC/AdeK/OprM family multidrug efflux complex outer membrane factor n=1 Tax=Uliginosibacterium sediminicola TaxID=2024550 RepID=A0ABU9Z3M3_9RHOO
MNRITLLSCCVAALLQGCGTLAPDFERPAASVANDWPQGQAYKPSTFSAQSTVAELGWRDFIADDNLRQLIELALANNRDLRVAIQNIDKARAQYQVQRADLAPSVKVSAGDTAQRTAATLSGTGEPKISRQYSVGLGFASYELDFFGRVRDLKDAALQTYLGTEDARRNTEISLIAEVANAYLTLAADQARLKLAQETYRSRSESLKLTQRSFDLGASSAVALNQARSSSESARADIASYTTQVARDENALTLLVGTALPRSLQVRDLEQSVVTTRELPAGLPSQVLQARPDIMQAERSLRAAYANIGAARAAFFPSITLTASTGSASSSLDGLFKDGSGTWSFAPQLNLPIFDLGRREANLDIAKLNRDIAVAQYDKAVQTAFREVADALAQRGTIDEQLAAQAAVVAASSESLKLTDARQRAGIDSYLALLDAQRTLYSAQQSLITVRLARESNLITLYKVLGGGLQPGKS